MSMWNHGEDVRDVVKVACIVTFIRVIIKEILILMILC